MSEASTSPQERRIMIVPAGLEKERIVDGCTAYAVNVVYLINNPKPTTEDKNIPAVYKYSLKFSKSIETEFKDSYRLVIMKEAKLNSFFDCIRALNEIFKKEIKINRLKEIFINISTASKAFALAAYIFGLFHPYITKIFYMGTSNYILLDHLDNESASLDNLRDEFLECGLTKRPYFIDEIPLLPIINFTQDEIELIKILSIKKKFVSIDDFMEKLPVKIKSFNRVKIRRILSSLEEKNLISIHKSGRYQEILVSKYLAKVKKIICSGM